MKETDNEYSGDSWSDILARRSPEGRAVVDELMRAEQTASAIRERIITAISDRRECDEDNDAFKAAMAEVNRMREKVYRMARQWQFEPRRVCRRRLVVSHAAISILSAAA